MVAIRSVIGARGAVRLWVRLLDAQAAEPTALQWLPLLACWLSDSAVQASAPGPHQPLPSPQQRPDGGSPPPQQDMQLHSASPAQCAAPGSPTQPARTPGRQTGSPARPAGSSGGGSERADPHAAAAGEASAMPLARSVEEALQLQEAAMRIGYGAAALPLWEAFLARYLAHQARPSWICVPRCGMLKRRCIAGA